MLWSCQHTKPTSNVQLPEIFYWTLRLMASPLNTFALTFVLMAWLATHEVVASCGAWGQVCLLWPIILQRPHLHGWQGGLSNGGGGHFGEEKVMEEMSFEVCWWGWIWPIWPRIQHWAMEWQLYIEQYSPDLVFARQQECCCWWTQLARAAKWANGRSVLHWRVMLRTVLLWQRNIVNSRLPLGQSSLVLKVMLCPMFTKMGSDRN